MIKLDRSSPPPELTTDVAAHLTEVFKKTGESVWHLDYLKNALANQSHKKCSFCECELGVESKYFEVEHFACKTKYPNEVMAWGNLLSACRRCNGKKGKHDVRLEPIVNPYSDLPRDHIRIQSYRMQAITPQGDLTIAVLGLNDPTRAMVPRFKIGVQLGDNLDALKEKIGIYKDKPTSLRKAKIVNCLEALMNECLGHSPYAATAASVLHNESIYPQLKIELTSLGLWNAEMQSFHDSSMALVLN